MMVHRISLLAVLCACLAACSSSGSLTPPAPSPAPVAASQPVCPPNPPAGSGFTCAPSKVCTSIPAEILRLDDGTIAGWVLSANMRLAVRNAVHAVQDACGVLETIKLPKVRG